MPDLTQSPRGQSYQVPPEENTADDLFKQNFGNEAFKLLNKTMPELLPNIATFRPLDVNAQEGRGVGAFILDQSGEILHIPVVVNDNSVEPIDVFYCKRLDSFLPLTSDWLREITKGVVQTLGDPVARPKTLRNNELLQPIMPGGALPGRFGFASDNSEDSRSWFRSLLEKDGHVDRPLMLPELMARAPWSVKVGFTNVVFKHERLRKMATQAYGRSTLESWRTAKRPTATKTAVSKEFPHKRDVHLITASMPMQEVKARVGKDGMPEAYKALRLRGFYIKDDRPKTDGVFSMATESQELVTPSYAGLYKVYLRDGKRVEALIIPAPIRLDSRYPKRNEEAMIVLRDGRYGKIRNILAEPMLSVSTTDVDEFIRPMASKTPVAQERGLLISTQGGYVHATEAMYARDVIKDDLLTTFLGHGVQITLSEKMSPRQAIVDTVGHVAAFGAGYRWLKLSDGHGQLTDEDFLRGQSDVFRAAENLLRKNGGEKLDVKAASDRGYYVNGQRYDEMHALVEVANRYNLSITDSEGVLKIARLDPSHSTWAYKRADGPPPQGDPNAQPGVDPSQQGMPPGTPPGPPPGPAPTDLAIAEQTQLLQQQIAALQQQQMMLMTIQQRTQQIAMGGGAMAAPMGAGAMAGGPVMGPNGMPAMAPMPQGMPGMPQGMPGMPGMPQGQPGMDPSQMQGQPGMPQGQPGMDPSQMQGQPGMDPSQMQQQLPPAPIMTNEPSPDNIAQQINPSFLGDAAKMMDDGVFDAAAVASLAQQSDLRALTQGYIPTFRDALDNLGRVLLLLRIHKANIVNEQLGNDAADEVLQRTRDTFNGLGDVLIKIDQSASQLAPNNTLPQ